MQDSKILESKLSDPVKVAKNGYEALMIGEDKIISGLKNKLMAGMSNVVPQSIVADKMNSM